MSKWKEHWQESLPYEKVFYVVSLILAGAAIITIGLIFFDGSPVVMKIIVPGLVALLKACEAVIWWRRERSLRIWYIACAALFAALTIWGITKVYC